MEPWIDRHPLLFFSCLLVAGYGAWGLALGILDARKVIKERDLPLMPMSRRDKWEAAAFVLLISLLAWPLLGLDILDEDDQDDTWPEA